MVSGTILHRSFDLVPEAQIGGDCSGFNSSLYIIGTLRGVGGGGIGGLNAHNKDLIRT